MMSAQPDRQPLDPEQADAIRAWAATERAKGDELAATLEDIAINGLPDPAAGVRWEELREQHLADLAGGQDGQRVA
jgi:hypothetical protein